MQNVVSSALGLRQIKAGEEADAALQEYRADSLAETIRSNKVTAGLKRSADQLGILKKLIDKAKTSEEVDKLLADTDAAEALAELRGAQKTEIETLLTEKKAKLAAETEKLTADVLAGKFAKRLLEIPDPVNPENFIPQFFGPNDVIPSGARALTTRNVDLTEAQKINLQGDIAEYTVFVEGDIDNPQVAGYMDAINRNTKSNFFYLQVPVERAFRKDTTKGHKIPLPTDPVTGAQITSDEVIQAAEAQSVSVEEILRAIGAVK